MPGLDVKAPVQPDHRKQRAAHHRHLLPAVDGGDGFLGRLQHLPHREDRDNVALVPHAHHQAVDDRERQRQLEQERGSFARLSK